MKICGLITEYNPFHTGHIIHIKKAKELTKADYLISIMSGYFVQRGEPAIMDKFLRAKMAVKYGIDLVIELPTVYALSDAGLFAKGAIHTLNSTQIIDHLCFGSKLNHVGPLYKIANALLNESTEFKSSLKKELKKGLNYPAAREKSLIEHLPDTPQGLLKDANTVLGIEYLKSLIELKSPIKASTYIREPGYQASDIRHKLLSKNTHLNREIFYESSYGKEPDYNTEDFISINDLSAMLQYRLLYKDFKEIYGVSSTLYNKINNHMEDFHHIEAFVEKLASKDITKTHIKRAFMHILLNIQSKDMKLIETNPPDYIRILACSDRGKHLIGLIAESLPVITNPNQVENLKNESSKLSLAIDLFASKVYNSARSVKYLNKKNEYRMKIF